MKKLLFVLALGVFAACGNGSGTPAATDSVAKDTTVMTPAPAAPDSAAMKMAADSAKMKMAADSAAAKMAADSAKHAKKGGKMKGKM